MIENCKTPAEGATCKVFLTEAQIEGGRVVIYGQEYGESNAPFSSLSTELQVHGPRLRKLEQHKPGETCVCKFIADQQWYRATLIRKLATGSWIVKFVDYGNCEQMTCDELRILPEKLAAALPQQALSMILDESLHPVGTAALWTPVITNIILNALLYADVDVKILKVISPGLVKVECAEIQKVICESGYAKEGLIYPYTKYSSGCQFKAYVSHILEDATFYLQEIKSATDLDKMMDKMSKYFRLSENKISLPKKNFLPGILMAAIYSQDLGIYRAQILDVDGDSATVYYVDYGDTEQQERVNMYILPKEFCDLEFQAIPCAFAEIMLAPAAGSPRVKKILCDRTANRILDVTVVDQIFDASHQLEVKALHKETNICLSILAEGLACIKSPKGKEKKKRRQLHCTEMTIGSTCTMILTHVEDSGDMYLTDVENSSQLNSLMDEIEKFCGKEDNLKSLTQVAVGDSCLALYDVDNSWYRAEILQLTGDGAFVRYVDYGNTSTLKLDTLKDIPADFTNLPCLGVPCCLQGDVTKKHVEALKLLQDQEMEVDFIGQTDEGLYTVYIKHEGRKVFDDLQCSIQSGVPISCQVDMQNMGRSDQSATMSVSTNTLPSVVNTRHSVYLENLYSPYVSFGSFNKVNVCFVEDVDCLWIQQGCNEKQLFDLMNNMKSYYSGLSECQNMLDEIRTDKLCSVCMSHIDNVVDWYRGRILCSYGDVVEVKLIDFGNDITVNKSDVRTLIPQFFHPKAQALKCQLNGVKPLNRKWTRAGVRQLKDLVIRPKENTLGRFVKKQNLTYLVDLVVNDDGKEVDVAKAMCDHGNAVSLQDDVVSNLVQSEPTVLKQSVALSIETPKLFYRSRGLAMVGAELRVNACTCQSPDEFFLQIVDLEYRQRYIKLFRKLYETINQQPSDISGEVYIGKPCAVYDQKTGDWCRAAILECLDQHFASVCLVDLGRITPIKYKDLKGIDEDFVKAEPPAALRCTLQGTVLPVGQWSEDAVNMFNDFFYQNTNDLVCTIHGCVGDTIGMAFMCSLKTPSTNIAVELINQGYCHQIPVLGTLVPPMYLKSFIYSNLDVGRGKEDMFYITHVESSTLFYCQLERNFAAFDAMMDQLQEHCANDTSQMLTLEEITHECMCFAKYHSEQWCRAHFISMLPDGNLQILFVDYGNVDSVTWGEVKRHSGDQFYKLPIMALPCCLSDAAVSQACGDISVQICRRMKETILEKLFTGVVTGCTNGKLHLDLFDNGKRINSQITGQTPVAVVGEKFSTSSSSDTDEEVINSRLHAELSDAFFLRVGVSEPSVLASCITPHHFYIHLGKLDEDKLQCEKAVDGFYTAVRNSDYPVFALNPGDTVCAWNKDDLKWCRATVLSVSMISDPLVDVLFVDSGRYGQVDKGKHVKQLIENLLKWPKMAVAVSLAGIQPKHPNSIWNQDAISEFKSLVSSGTLKAKFLHQQDSGTWMVTVQVGEEDVAQKLVQKNVACWKDEECRVFDLHPNDDILKPSFLQPGQNDEVYISHVDSHNIVFVQKVETFKDLKTMMSDINKDAGIFEKFYSMPNPGDVCLAKYDVDGLLYRAKVAERILSNYEDEAMLFIQFVDYGNGCGAPLTNIYHCPAKYLKQPEFAIRCKVVNVPAELSNDDAFLKLGDLSVSEDVAILCSTNSFDSSENCHKVNLKIKTSDKPPISLPGFWSKNTENKAGKNELLCYKEMENLEGQSNNQVYICHVVNPGEVYCQLSKSCDKLEELATSISNYFDEHAGDKSDLVSCVEDVPLGCSCIAKFSSDGGWYRAIVTGNPGCNSIAVKFVDYGNDETLSLKDIRRAKVGFCVYPMQAIHCKLVSVASDADSWSADQIAEFDARVATLELNATFCSCVDESSRTYEVMLRLPDGTLLNKEYAHSGSRSPCPDDGFVPIASSVELQDNDGTAENSCISDGLSPCEKVGSSAAPTLILKKISIEKGSTFAAFVSFAEDPSNFYIQLANCEEILESIQKCVDDLVAQEFALEEFDVDSFCVAQSPEDGSFYRGQIKEANDEDATILFVDYGNQSSVKWNRILSCTSTVLELPAQAIHCCLSNVPSYTSENAIKSAIDMFLSMTIDKELVVTFGDLLQDECWSVEIEVEGINVLNLLRDIEVEAKDETKDNIMKMPKVAEVDSSTSDSSDSSESSSSDESDSSDGEESSSESASSVVESGVESVSGREQCSSPHLSPIQPLEKLQHNNPTLNTDQRLPERKFANGALMKATIIAGISTSQFFVRLDSDPNIVAMMEEIKYPAEDTLHRDVCIAKLRPEDNWQRARVFLENDSTKTLLFVDCGKVINSKRFLTAAAPDHLLNLPSQAICCKLTESNASPQNFCSGVLGLHVLVEFGDSSTHHISKFPIDKWTVDVTLLGEKLESFLVKENMLKSGDNKKEQAAEFKPDAVSTPLLPEILITDVAGASQRHGQQNTSHLRQLSSHLSAHARQLEDMAGQGATHHQLIQFTRSLMSLFPDVSRTKIDPSTIGADGDKNLDAADGLEDHKRPSSPVSRTMESPCKKPRLDADATSAQTTVCSLTHPLSQLSYQVYKELPVPTQPIKVGDVHEAFMSHIISLDNFYVKPCFLLGEKDVCSIKSTPPLLETIMEGCLCSVKPCDKDQYCRCVVLTVESEQVTTIDIDSGEIMVSDITQVYVLPESCKCSPPLAVQCSLSGIRPFDEIWSSGAIKVFKDFVSSDSEQSIRVEFVQSPTEQSTAWKVQISTNTSDLAEVLVEKKLAQKVVTDENLNQGVAKKLIKEKSAPLYDIEPSLPSLPSISGEEMQVMNPNTYTITPKVLTVSLDTSMSVISDSVFASENESSIKNASPGLPKKLSWSIYHSSSEQEPIEKESQNEVSTNLVKDLSEQKGCKKNDGDLKNEIDELVQYLVDSSLPLNQKFSVFGDSQEECDDIEVVESVQSIASEKKVECENLSNDQLIKPSEIEENNEEDFVRIAEKIVEQICSRAIETAVVSPLLNPQTKANAKLYFENPSNVVDEVLTGDQCKGVEAKVGNVIIAASPVEHGDPPVHMPEENIDCELELIPKQSAFDKQPPVTVLENAANLHSEPEAKKVTDDEISLLSDDRNLEGKSMCKDVCDDSSNANEEPEKGVAVSRDPCPQETEQHCVQDENINKEEDCGIVGHKLPLINVDDEQCEDAGEAEEKTVRESFAPESMKDQFLSTPKHEEVGRDSGEVSVYGTPLSIRDDEDDDSHDNNDVTVTHSCESERSEAESPQDEQLFVSAIEDSQ